MSRSKSKSYRNNKIINYLKSLFQPQPNIFHDAPIEKIVSGYLKSKQPKHKQIKGIAGQIKGLIRKKASHLPCEVHEKIIFELQTEIKRLKIVQNQERRWRKLLQKHNIPFNENPE